MPSGWKGELLDSSSYFKGKKIMETGERYTKELGKYPVISLSLKSAKQPDFQMAYASLVDKIIKKYRRHSYVMDGNALTGMKGLYRKVKSRIRKRKKRLFHISTFQRKGNICPGIQDGKIHSGIR